MQIGTVLSNNAGQPPTESRIAVVATYNPESGVATVTATLPAPLAVGQTCRVGAYEVDPLNGPQQATFDQFTNEGQSEFNVEFVYTPGRQVLLFAAVQ